MFSDRLISPVERVTMAFMPSGVMSMLPDKDSAQNRFCNIYEFTLARHIVCFWVVGARGQSGCEMCLCVKGFSIEWFAGQPASVVFRVFWVAPSHDSFHTWCKKLQPHYYRNFNVTVLSAWMRINIIHKKIKNIFFWEVFSTFLGSLLNVPVCEANVKPIA